MSLEICGNPPDVCERCGDSTMICQNCDEAITDCECGTDAEPTTCDVCGGGAAILRDGQMVPITELLEHLNSTAAEITRLRELTQWRPIADAGRHEFRPLLCAYQYPSAEPDDEPIFVGLCEWRDEMQGNGFDDPGMQQGWYTSLELMRVVVRGYMPFPPPPKENT